MPTYFDPEYFDEMGPDDVLDGNEHEQIRALRDYILTIPDASEDLSSQQEATAIPSSSAGSG